MVIVGRETGEGPTGHLVGLRGGVGSSTSVQLCWVNAKVCHVRGLPVGSVRVAYVDWRRKHICHVYQVSLAGYTLIRITATLEYE
jgi:hypothetical protein